MYLNGEPVINLIIPDNVTQISSYAFYNCSSLTTVTIPSSVKSIGGFAFYGCNSLTAVTIPDGITSIGNSMFYNCTSLTAVTIPNSITSIGSNAFYGCNNLNSVHMTDIASWCNISFASHNSNPLYFAHNLYLDGELVTNLVIPDGVTSIGIRAFCGCNCIISVTIPNSVTKIGSYAFLNCSGITYVYYHGNSTEWNEISIGGSNNAINNAVRYYCKGICGDNLTWKFDSNGTLSISGTGGMTDYSLSSDVPWYNLYTLIKTVVIEKGVTRIGNYAFNGCSNLTDLYYNSSKNDWDSIEKGIGNDELIVANVHFIPTLVCTSSVLNGNIVIQVASDEIISTQDLIIAVYSNENVMLNYIIVPHFGDYNTVNTVFKDDPEAGYAKVFLWESISALNPGV